MFTLKKTEILSAKKQIAELFKSDKSMFGYPLKVFYLFSDKNDLKSSKVLFAVSVPKKKFKKAHDRNLLKRRIRESYRLNKYELLNQIAEDKQLTIMVVYIANKIENYQLINKSMLRIMNNLNNQVIK